ncbi:SLC22A4_5 [Lepeophtheirus salmonis]|uniref:SLC22A4_5 n=1 Tax=Lepeophtheirus salmonis TaxID=72036 RepID=A0A7R8CTU0_LEPSM|nr:SLC22A4_5 [Lepeophtheirus salmonis]CAF2928517.1 SLC22A4_5 [Lepeophtheirus salmonis]
MKIVKAFRDNMAKNIEAGPLSRRTVARMFTNIHDHVAVSLEQVMQDSKYFSLALDENTDVMDVSQVLVFSKGSDIFSAVTSAVIEYGGFEKLSTVVTDGAIAMVERYRWFAWLLRQSGVNCPILHHPSAPLCLIGVYYWTTPESPRWLLSKGRCEEATSIMEKVIKSNGHNIEYKVLLEKMKSISKSNENAAASYNYWDLFKFPSLRIKIFVLSILWTTISAIYYVILLDQQELSDNIYIGFLITAVVQIPGYVISIQMIQHPRLGRKMSLIIMLILSGSCLCIHPDGEAVKFKSFMDEYYKLYYLGDSELGGTMETQEVVLEGPNEAYDETMWHIPNSGENA